MKRPLCVLCYLVVATLGAAILSSTVFISSAAAQSPDEVIMRDQGTWKAELTMHSPEGEMKMSGVEVNRPVGPWMVSSFKGEIEGQQFEGHAVYGYDELKEAIVGTWVDNMGMPGVPRHMTIMEGNYDKELDAIVTYQDGYSMTGERVKEKHVASYDGKDKRTLVMYQQGADGEWAVMMEIKYTRSADTGSDGVTVDN